MCINFNVVLAHLELVITNNVVVHDVGFINFGHFGESSGLTPPPVQKK